MKKNKIKQKDLLAVAINSIMEQYNNPDYKIRNVSVEGMIGSPSFCLSSSGLDEIEVTISFSK